MSWQSFVLGVATGGTVTSWALLISHLLNVQKAKRPGQ